MERHSNTTLAEILPSWIIPIDILCLTLDIFAVLAALLSLFFIVFDKLYKTVPMILITTSCLSEFFLGVFLLMKDSLALYYDIHQIYLYDWICLLTGCLGYGSIILQNYSYLLQAAYRYMLIVHPTRIFYQKIQIQIFLILILCICCIIYPISVLYTGQIKYLSDEAICEMPLGLSFITIFNVGIVYFIPMSSIMIVYLKMVRHVNQMSKRITPANRLSHARRQLTMVRRIVALVFILLILGLPYVIFIFMSFFNSAPKYHFRIAFTFISAALVVVIITLFQITEPLKASILNKSQIVRVNTVQPIS